MNKFVVNRSDGSYCTGNISPVINDSGTYLTIESDMYDYTTAESIDVLLHENIPANSLGFYILSGAGRGAELRDTGIGYFKEHEDISYINFNPHMSVFCVNYNNKGYVYIVTGMKEAAAQKIVIKNNNYSLYFHFEINNEMPYENIEIIKYELHDDISYSAMARTYRDFCFKNGYVKIKDRLNDELKYATESLMVRVRLAWKPVPCEILEQTIENEPPVHVACTFKDVENLMHKYKEAGIDKAEFCLVGWNIKGHDGRWPQILPVEESIGGKDGLISLIETGKKLGYNICCHTNSTDGYIIANNFTEDDIALEKDGSKSIQAEIWSGGRTYNVCPKRSLDFAKDTLPDVAELGFRGTHYIDVITATPPRYCYNKNHPVNRKEGVAYLDQVLKLSKKLFGCVGSECGFEHNLKNCDYVLYSTFRKSFNSDRDSSEFDLVDKYIPFWQIVFHGTVLYNPSATSVNAIFNKDKDALLKVIEYGGRPAIYYYAKFKSKGDNWIGDKDFKLDTPEETEETVIGAKQTYDIYKELSFLQYELIEKHEQISENVFETTYSDGSVITVDYNKKTYCLQKGN